MGNKEKTLTVIVGPEGSSKYMIDGVEVDKRNFVEEWPSKDGNLKISISGDDEESDQFTRALLKDLPKSQRKEPKT